CRVTCEAGGDRWLSRTVVEQGGSLVADAPPLNHTRRGMPHRIDREPTPAGSSPGDACFTDRQALTAVRAVTVQLVFSVSHSVTAWRVPPAARIGSTSRS